MPILSVSFVLSNILSLNMGVNGGVTSINDNNNNSYKTMINHVHLQTF
jgi:hypothetical protein